MQQRVQHIEFINVLDVTNQMHIYIWNNILQNIHKDYV